MKLISHRGNLNGKSKNFENKPTYLDKAIQEGFDVEIDVWCVYDLQLGWMLFLGHDKPQYNVDFNWFYDRISKLWIHCKNIDAMSFFKNCEYSFNYFWHQQDDVTITSMGYFWTYPGKQLTIHSVAVLPEVSNFLELDIAYGICSDYIIKYQNL